MARTDNIANVCNLTHSQSLESNINPFTLRVPLISIVCYFHAFGNNLGIKHFLENIWRRNVNQKSSNNSTSNSL